MISYQASNVHRWISWTIPMALVVAAITHSIIVGLRMRPTKTMTKDEKSKQTAERRENILRILVGYLIGGVSAWLAIVNLFLPPSFSPESMKKECALSMRLIGFAWLAFAVGGIISAVIKNVDEQRVAVATFTVYMLGATGVQLYTLKGKSKPIQVYHVPVLKFVIIVLLITFASITPNKKK